MGKWWVKSGQAWNFSPSLFAVLLSHLALAVEAAAKSHWGVDHLWWGSAFSIRDSRAWPQDSGTYFVFLLWLLDRVILGSGWQLWIQPKYLYQLYIPVFTVKKACFSCSYSSPCSVVLELSTQAGQKHSPASGPLLQPVFWAPALVGRDWHFLPWFLQS